MWRKQSEPHTTWASESYQTVAPLHARPRRDAGRCGTFCGLQAASKAGSCIGVYICPERLESQIHSRFVVSITLLAEAIITDWFSQRKHLRRELLRKGAFWKNEGGSQGRVEF